MLFVQFNDNSGKEGALSQVAGPGFLPETKLWVNVRSTVPLAHPLPFERWLKVCVGHCPGLGAGGCLQFCPLCPEGPPGAGELLGQHERLLGGEGVTLRDDNKGWFLSGTVLSLRRKQKEDLAPKQAWWG